MIARASVRLDADGTADYRLKLPKGTKAGRYTLKATYRAITASRSLTLTGKPSARRASASSVPGVASAPDRARSPTGASTAPGPRPHVHGALSDGAVSRRCWRARRSRSR